MTSIYSMNEAYGKSFRVAQCHDISTAGRGFHLFDAISEDRHVWEFGSSVKVVFVSLLYVLYASQDDWYYPVSNKEESNALDQFIVALDLKSATQKLRRPFADLIQILIRSVAPKPYFCLCALHLRQAEI